MSRVDTYLTFRKEKSGVTELPQHGWEKGYNPIVLSEDNWIIHDIMKLERLLAIIMLLLNRNQISAKELAEYFEVSKRTIYRDIDTINQAGIPIVSYMGAEGGFGILENYKITKNFLDDYEINSLLSALKNLNNTVNDKKISQYRSLIHLWIKSIKK